MKVGQMAVQVAIGALQSHLRCTANRLAACAAGVRREECADEEFDVHVFGVLAVLSGQ